MPRYSIILPVRNGGSYVKECIQSILSQSIDNYNLIVLDNRSNDGTLEWIQSLRNDKIVIYQSQEDLSIEQNWARIKTVPKNEFMTMIGHDDLLHPGYLQEMENMIEMHPVAGLYQTHFDFIDENGAFLRNCIPMAEEQQVHEFLASQMTRSIDSTGTGYMMRSNDFDSLGGMPPVYPNLIFADFQLWVSLMLSGYKATSAKPCFSYRIHQSISRTTNGMAYQKAFGLYIEFLIKVMQQDDRVKVVIRLHGKKFLLYYTEALAHRLLKTPMNLRTILVSDLVKKCEELASRFIPGQTFTPKNKVGIKIAELIDRYPLLRKLFQRFKRIK